VKILIETARQANGVYRAWCPALPGCAVYAETREQAQSRIRDAVVGYLASMDVPLPREPGTNLVVEDVAAPQLPASPPAGPSGKAGGRAVAAGCDRSRRRENCYARS